ncbi:MAG: hypothetical protein NT024_02065, partial [Proteobacteria bacterium]|nr:hypothetical protein [Pseudomonadota bacterium]
LMIARIPGVDSRSRSVDGASALFVTPKFAAPSKRHFRLVVLDPTHTCYGSNGYWSGTTIRCTNIS